MDIKKFKLGIAQLAEEKGISREKIIEIIESAVAAAYKKDYGKKNEKIKAELDVETGEFKFWQAREVVTEDMILTEEELEKLRSGGELEEKKIHFSPERHIELKDAKKIDADVEVGGELLTPLEARKEYGRIAAQTAKQVILQGIKETERNLLHDEYKNKEGEVISGSVQRVSGRKIYFDLGKILGILPQEEQIPGEYYEIGQRFKLYVLEVRESTKGPVVYLSRAFPKFISKLFQVEVPEISTGEVEIRSIAREPGSRSKVAVSSNNEEIDPIGAAIGQRGARVSAIISELGGEKIDIIKYADEPEEYIANALSPAKVLQTKPLSKNKALCIVPDDQLSLAIGKEGQNVRLAAKLTGWKIDVQSIGQWENEQEEKAEQESSSADVEDAGFDE